MSAAAFVLTDQGHGCGDTRGSLFPLSIRHRKEEDKPSKEGLGAPIVGVGEQEWRKKNKENRKMYGATPYSVPRPCSDKLVAP
jgi:hypothetical protein